MEVKIRGGEENETMNAEDPGARASIVRRSFPDPALYPFASRLHESEDGTLHYVDEGEGRPIVFVHGTPSWSFEWRHAIGALRAGHRCLALDHLGFGLSAKPREAAYAPADHARRFVDWVRALDLRDVLLVVHDFGGPIGLPLALEEPERVRGVVMLNTWMWAHGGEGPVSKLSRFIASPLGRFLYRWLNASPRWLVPATFADRSALTPEVHRHYTAPFGSRAERTAPWVLGCELARSDPYYASLWEKRAALASMPVTIVWGTQDPAFGLPYLERWRAALPEARVHTLPVGHFPQEEAPAEVTAWIGGAAE
jgi:pimeloyl-ACP methyl ester carboxylesterase